MKDPYSVLGVSRNATDEEIRTAYRDLVRKYHPDNYQDDNPLKDLANEKMQEVNEAYEAIQVERSNRGADPGNASGNASDGFGNGYQSSATGIYAEIRKLINDRRFTEADAKLMGVPEDERTADWHYLSCVILMRRGRVNDAMRELEIACDMDPSNMEYQKAKEMFNNNANGYGSTYWGGVGNGPARSSTDDACNCCADLICLDCICEMCGGDLIPCL